LNAGGFKKTLFSEEWHKEKPLLSQWFGLDNQILPFFDGERRGRRTRWEIFPFIECKREENP
jgi:hypothetical protein